MEQGREYVGQEVILCPKCESNEVSSTISWMGIVGVMTMAVTGLSISGRIFTDDINVMMAYGAILGVLLVNAEVIRMLLPVDTHMKCSDCHKMFKVSEDTFKEYANYNYLAKEEMKKVADERLKKLNQ